MGNLVSGKKTRADYTSQTRLTILHLDKTEKQCAQKSFTNWDLPKLLSRDIIRHWRAIQISKKFTKSKNSKSFRIIPKPKPFGNINKSNPLTNRTSKKVMILFITRSPKTRDGIKINAAGKILIDSKAEAWKNSKWRQKIIIIVINFRISLKFTTSSFGSKS